MTAQLPPSARRFVPRSGIALLLALFTLLCAICPLGLPASQKLGPAFNPANEAVTVRPEAKLPVARATADTPDPRGPVPATVRMHTLPPSRIAAPSSIVTATVAPLASPAHAPFAARAPPARA